MFRSLWKWLSGWLRGGPHFVVGSRERPYLLRWYVLPRNRWLNVYLHKFCRDDDDRALHDHPWPYLSIILRGGYREISRGLFGHNVRWCGPGAVLRRRAAHAHRVELRDGRPCWTLFITGQRVRDWGFHCPGRWVPWQEFTAPGNAGETGKGCGEATS